jgi:hypothetical protein
MGVMDKTGWRCRLFRAFITSSVAAWCCQKRRAVGKPGRGIQSRPGSFALVPGKQPFHTLNPAAARLKDGRTMVYGTMGATGNRKRRPPYLPAT